MITKFKKPVAASGTTVENEPIIKSDGASSDVMQWLSNDESSNITISEDGSNNLDLVVSAGLVNITGGGGSNLPGKLRLSNKAGTVTSGSSLGEIEFYSGDLSAGGPYVSASIVAKQENTNPTTGALSFNVGYNHIEALTIDSAGNVGINYSPAHQLDVAGVTKTIASGSSVVAVLGTDAYAADTGGSLGLYGKFNASGSYAEHAVIGGFKENATEWDTASYLVLGTRPNGGAVTERLRIDSTGLATFSNGIAVTTGGVKFPATQSASADANTLDDYEEGSFSPTLVSTDATFSYTVQSGWYTKIGNTVSIRFYVLATASGTTSNSTVIGGLPFASVSGSVYNQAGIAMWSNAANVLQPLVTAAASSIGLWKQGAVSHETAVNISGKYLVGGGTYQTA